MRVRSRRKRVRCIWVVGWWDGGMVGWQIWIMRVVGLEFVGLKVVVYEVEYGFLVGGTEGGFFYYGWIFVYFKGFVGLERSVGDGGGGVGWGLQVGWWTWGCKGGRRWVVGDSRGGGEGRRDLL